jgi:hypothetical protein
MTVPGEIGAVISEALQSGDRSMALEISDYAFENDEILWADLWINHVPVSFMRNDDGSFVLTMTCVKDPEGDDQRPVRPSPVRWQCVRQVTRSAARIQICQAAA